MRFAGRETDESSVGDALGPWSSWPKGCARGAKALVQVRQHCMNQLKTQEGSINSSSSSQVQWPVRSWRDVTASRTLSHVNGDADSPGPALPCPGDLSPPRPDPGSACAFAVGLASPGRISVSGGSAIETGLDHMFIEISTVDSRIDVWKRPVWGELSTVSSSTLSRSDST